MAEVELEVVTNLHYYESLEQDGQNKHRIAFRDWVAVTRDIKQTVICAHGFSRNSLDFDHVGKTLAATGKYHVYAFDTFGRGESDWLQPGSQEYYDMPTYVNDIINLFKHLNIERVDFWIGTSMGGLQAMNLCAKNPLMIKNLILNDVGAVVSTKGLKRINGYVGKGDGFETLEECKERMKTIFWTIGKLSEEQWDEFTKSSFKFDETTKRYKSNYDPRIAGGQTEPWYKAPARWALMAVTQFELEVSMERLWVNVACPTLLVRGATSDILPARAFEVMKKNRPDTELLEIPEVGHAPSLLFESETTPILAWMAKHPA